jgi:hypothetical protein
MALLNRAHQGLVRVPLLGLFWNNFRYTLIFMQVFKSDTVNKIFEGVARFKSTYE